MSQIKFHPCLSEEALQLQQVIEAGATYAEDTFDLGTVFLIIKEIETNESLEDSIDPIVLANGFLDCLDEPYKKYLPAHHAIQPWWEIPSSQEAERIIVRLLTHSVVAEPSAFDYVEPAIEFTHKLLQLIGESCHFVTNVKRRIHWRTPDDYYLENKAGFGVFNVGSCWDEGIILISLKRIGMLWFLGYD
ncbi:MAG: hypothetical protein KME45_06200 [Stenomitos rutilans HA7619-LM2]|jgi:hypothetical protein|nr:hypothetical protein [Stenomitos rutilans HA7619-LM2]